MSHSLCVNNCYVQSEMQNELFKSVFTEHLMSASLPVFSRSQQAFMQNSLSQPSPIMLSGTALHSYPGVQPTELAKPQSSLAFQQTSNAQHIPILFEPQLNQPSGIGGSQLIDTHILQVLIWKLKIEIFIANVRFEM